MSESSEDQRTQTPQELGAALAEQLGETVPPELLRRLEPEAAFSPELTWRHAGLETQ